MNILDHGYIKLIETWGSDERIIESARMSTDKGFLTWDAHWRCRTCGCRWRDHGNNTASLLNDSQSSCAVCELSPMTTACEWVSGDDKLLHYLWTHKHHTPFEMAGATIEVQAPIFVFREWHRHRTQSYNELSARYTELPDMYYVPSVERVMGAKQATTNKQSSTTGIPQDAALAIQQKIAAANLSARATYDELLAVGVAREVARVVVPVSQYSRMRASANLRNWLAFLTLRVDAAAQWEIRQYATALTTLLAPAFPRSMQLWSA